MSYDLFLQRMNGPRDAALSEELGRALSELTTMGRCGVSSLYAKPDDADVGSLIDLLEEDPSAAERFAAVCAERGIEVDAASGDTDVAAAFLDKEWGAKLVCVVMPKTGVEADVVEAYAAVIEFARERGLVVHDPQLGEDLDLTEPGILPPKWQAFAATLKHVVESLS